MSHLIPLPGQPGSLPTVEWALLTIAGIAQTNVETRGYGDLDPRDLAPEFIDAAVNSYLLAAIDALSTLAMRSEPPDAARPWCDRSLPVFQAVHALIVEALDTLADDGATEIDGTEECMLLLEGIRVAAQAGLVAFAPQLAAKG